MTPKYAWLCIEQIDSVCFFLSFGYHLDKSCDEQLMFSLVWYRLVSIMAICLHSNQHDKLTDVILTFWTRVAVLNELLIPFKCKNLRPPPHDGTGCCVYLHWFCMWCHILIKISIYKYEYIKLYMNQRSKV